MIAPMSAGEAERQLALRDEAAGSELLRRLRTRVAAEVRRLERELTAFQDEWPRPPGNARQRFATGPAWTGPAAATLGGYAPTAGAARARLALMRQLERALADVGPGDLYPEWAGVGSIVMLEDVASGERFEYLLMPGDVADLDAGHVSLASPIGRAVLGRGVGATVEVALPGGRRTFRIRSLTTLPVLLGATARDLDESGRSQRTSRASARPRL